jgi:hypothetical protein
VSIILFFNWDATDREKEPWLSTIIIFKEHVWIAVRAYFGIECQVFFILVFFFSFLYFLLTISFFAFFKNSCFHKLSQLLLTQIGGLIIFNKRAVHQIAGIKITGDLNAILELICIS